MADARLSPPPSPPSLLARVPTPWMAFAALIVCFTVAAGVRTGLGRPAGWLDELAGRSDAVPTFARARTSAAPPGHMVRIEPLDRATLEGMEAPAPAPQTAVTASSESPAATSSANDVAVGMPQSSPLPAASETVQGTTSVSARPPGHAATRPITRAAPLRVYVAGDSSAQPLGYEIQKLSAKDELVNAVVDFRISSGLTNPGFFDWPTRLRAAMAVQPPPEVVVIMLGGNDALMMRTPDGTMAQPGQPGWTEEYKRRAGEMMDIAGKGGARVYWVGMPVVRDGTRNISVVALDQAALAAAAERPWVRFIDVSPLFGDVSGDYSAYRPDPDGEPTRVRQDDGIHLNGTGSKWVAEIVYDLMAQDERLSQ